MNEGLSSRYDINAAANEAEILKKKVKKGLTEDYQEASNDLDAENVALLRSELLALTGADDEEDKITTEHIRDFLGTDQEK